MIRIFNKENKDDLVEFEMTNLLNVREAEFGFNFLITSLINSTP